MSTQKPLIQPSSGPDGSPTPCPNQHVKTIVELLREGSPELGRRWLAALMLVPPEERATVVEAVESRIVISYGGAAKPLEKDQRDREFVVVYPPKVKADHVEQIERTYEIVEPKPKAKQQTRKRRA